MRECRHDLGRPHVFVKTRTKEFHYPKGDDNVTTTYDGEGGVAVNSFFRKNQQGSQVIQGTLLVVPIEESLLYIRPLYLRAAGGRIPEMKRVIVAHQNQIVMEETLEAAEEAAPVGRVATEGGARARTASSRLLHHSAAAASVVSEASRAPARPHTLERNGAAE